MTQGPPTGPAEGYNYAALMAAMNGNVGIMPTAMQAMTVDANAFALENAPKHSLQTPWCLWVQIHAKTGKKWSDNLQNMYEFDTVEDFWSMFNHIHSPRTAQGADLSIFRKGVSPAWEDPACQTGGRWIASFAKLRASSLEAMWLDLLIAMIGEDFHDEYGGHVLGTVCSSRGKTLKMSLWISEKEEQKAMALGFAFKRILMHSDPRTTIEMQFEDFSTNKRPYSISSKDDANRTSAEAAAADVESLDVPGEVVPTDVTADASVDTLAESGAADTAAADPAIE